MVGGSLRFPHHHPFPWAGQPAGISGRSGCDPPKLQRCDISDDPLLVFCCFASAFPPPSLLPDSAPPSSCRAAVRHWLLCRWRKVCVSPRSSRCRSPPARISLLHIVLSLFISFLFFLVLLIFCPSLSLSLFLSFSLSGFLSFFLFLFSLSFSFARALSFAFSLLLFSFLSLSLSSVSFAFHLFPFSVMREASLDGPLQAGVGCTYLVQWPLCMRGRRACA